MISLNFDDADVFSVVQTVFGDILRVNYVVDARIKGRVTFRSVAPISTDQVLPIMEVILRLNGIGVVEDNGLYRVVPLAEVSREPSPVSFGRDASKIPITGKSIIQVVPVVYLQSTEVVKLITPFLSANAVVLDVPKSNQLIIVDTDASVRRVLQLIDTFDNEKQKKKRATVYVYHAQNGKAKDIANLLNQIFLGTRPGLSPTTGLGGTTSMAGARPGTPGVTGPTGAMGATSMPGQSSVLPSPSMAQPMVGQAQAAGTELLVSPLTRIYSDDGINSIIVLSTPEDYETIKETIAKIDILPRQVVIEAVIAQITLTGDLSLGLAYSMNTLNLFGLSGTMNLEGSVLQGQQTTLPSQSGNGFTFIGTDDKGIVRAYVNALAKNSKAKLLAAPHILVTDNREARIQVGSQVPIISAETYGSTTVAPQRTVQYKDIGIILKVKPQINASGLVAMEMSQEVSTFRTIALFANEQQIVIDKTEASSNLVVQDSQTIIIGGLIREDRSRSGNGIPFLMDIPILGYLFGNWTAGSTRTELIILLTPHVMKDQREARAITKEYVDNITNLDTGKGGLTRNELMKGGVQIKGGLSQPSGPETPEDPYVFVPMPGRFPGSQDIPGGPMKPQPGPMIRP